MKLREQDHLVWPFFDDVHRKLAGDLRAWAEREVAHASVESDVDAACRELVRQLGESDWLRFCVPASHGGAFAKLDVRALCICRETLAQVAGLADFAFAMQGLGAGPIALYGSDELKDRYLPGVRDGQKHDGGQASQRRSCGSQSRIPVRQRVPQHLPAVSPRHAARNPVSRRRAVRHPDVLPTGTGGWKSPKGPGATLGPPPGIGSVTPRRRGHFTGRHMHQRTLRTIMLAAGVFAGTYSCVDQSPSAPSGPALVRGSGGLAAHQGWEKMFPGQQKEGSTEGQQNAWLVQCQQHPAFQGSGDIGPSGGQIIAGPHRLIIPPGALQEVVHITATVPEGDNVFVSFEPSGLTFKKPAGLLLDAEGCDLSGYDAPDVVYLNDAGEEVERIEAVYSSHWKTVAAPIWHFSGYAIAW